MIASSRAAEGDSRSCSLTVSALCLAKYTINNKHGAEKADDYCNVDVRYQSSDLRKTQHEDIRTEDT